jgi:transposase
MSTKQTRRRFSSEFKFKVVLDALKERQSLAELSQKYEVIQVMICRWKSEFLEAAPRVFSKAKSEDTKGLEAANEKLYTEIGRQKIEIDFLKKFTRNWGNESPRQLRESCIDSFGTSAMRASDGHSWPIVLCAQGGAS